MVQAASFATELFYVKLWSGVPFSVDTPYLGHYRIRVPSFNLTREELAGHVITYFNTNLGLNQPHLLVCQIYDHNGHEIARTVSSEADPKLWMAIDIERRPDSALPRFVEATRTVNDSFSRMYTT